jgi:hypothetical protein
MTHRLTPLFHTPANPPPASQFADGRVDVVYTEVEDRIAGGYVIGLRVDQRAAAAGQVQRQQPVVFGRAEPEGLSVEFS